MNNGLIFAFRWNEQISKPTIVGEIILNEITQPTEIYKKYGAVVLSEWFKHKSFLKENNEAINLVQNVHNQRGFGSRNCASSAGTKVHEGKRQTLATVGSPL